MLTVAQTIFYIFGCILWLGVMEVSGSDTPVNFPPTISVTRGTYQNWANALEVDYVWFATPKTEGDVVTLANWAYQNGFKLRASGYMHNWSPLTVTTNDDVTKIVLVDTTVNLNNIQPPTKITNTTSTVTTQTGASMTDLLTFLEDYELGLYAVPAPGDLTVGGVLAIGGHGTGVPYEGEVVPDGQALGTVSNLVVAFKAVVWNGTSYVAQTFQRSDADASAFLIHLGRAFILEVTLMAGLNYNLRCQSYTTVTKKELFSLNPGSNALSTLLDKSGRVEIITFPFTDTPWLKVWTIAADKPLPSRQVSTPFNYPFSDDLIPQVVFNIYGEVAAGSYFLTPILGQTQIAQTAIGLTTFSASDIWGPSKNLLLYIRPTTLRVTANGYAVTTSRSNVQKVVNTFVTYFDSLVEQYQDVGEYPFNGPIEIRVTTLDNPINGIGGVVPTLSAIKPRTDYPTYDTVIWFDVLSIPTTPNLAGAMNTLESFVINEFNGTYATVRPEWSKGWAYSAQGAWSNSTVYQEIIPKTFPVTTATDGWNWAVATLNKYDPNRIFTNSFIDSLLQKTSN